MNLNLNGKILQRPYALAALSVALLGGCENLSTPPNRSAVDPSNASAAGASARRFRPNLVATTQIYLDPSVGRGAQKMDHSKMQGMEGMDHSKMEGVDTNKPAQSGAMEGMDHSKMSGMEAKASPAASQQPAEMQGMDHAKMEGMAKPAPNAQASPASKEAVKTEMKKTSDEMKKLSDELKAKADAEKGAEKPAGSPAALYTCPMHPEIRQPNPGKCPKCGMTLLKAEKK